MQMCMQRSVMSLMLAFAARLPAVERDGPSRGRGDSHTWCGQKGCCAASQHLVSHSLRRPQSRYPIWGIASKICQWRASLASQTPFARPVKSGRLAAQNLARSGPAACSTWHRMELQARDLSKANIQRKVATGNAERQSCQGLNMLHSSQLCEIFVQGITKASR